MNNNLQSKLGECKLGEWTELNLQELDQIFGGNRWMGNGYVFDLNPSKPKYIFSKPKDEWPEGEAPTAPGGEMFSDHADGKERRRWVNGVDIFDMKLGVKWEGFLKFGQYIYFRDLEGQVWERKVNFGLSGDGYDFNPI